MRNEKLIEKIRETYKQLDAAYHAEIDCMIDREVKTELQNNAKSLMAEFTVLAEQLEDMLEQEPPEKIWLVKNYNDELAYGEEYIKVFANKADAVKHFRKLLEESFDCDYESIPTLMCEDSTFDDDYVCDGPFGGPYEFWIIEEKEINKK